jgi:hypothetical protein
MRSTMILLSAMLFFPIAQANPVCNDTSLARLESARTLLGELEEVPDVRKAMQVERVRILLEKVISSEPECSDATLLKREADRLFEEVEILSSAAALETVLTRAEGLVSTLERTESIDPAELQATRFLLAALARRLPNEPKVLDLSERAAGLKGAK